MNRRSHRNHRNHRGIAFVAALAVALAALPALAADAPKGVVNVNTATAAQIDLIPGVGPALAQRIVDHRQKNGAFQKPEDLMLVRGIGEKSFAKLRPYVATSGDTTLQAPARRGARTAKKASPGN